VGRADEGRGPRVLRARGRLVGVLVEFKRPQRLERSVIDSAPEWEKANATLKHRLREVMAELEDLRSQVLAVLPRREA
jgi:hypothetical protein